MSSVFCAGVFFALWLLMVLALKRLGLAFSIFLPTPLCH